VNGTRSAILCLGLMKRCWYLGLSPSVNIALL